MNTTNHSDLQAIMGRYKHALKSLGKATTSVSKAYWGLQVDKLADEVNAVRKDIRLGL